MKINNTDFLPGNKLTRAGLWKTVRRAISLEKDFYIATETLECSRCHKKMAGHDNRILEQMDDAHRSLFPAVLTYRLAIDKKLLIHMRQRGLGNSATSFYTKTLESYSTHYLECVSRYFFFIDILFKSKLFC